MLSWVMPSSPDACFWYAGPKKILSHDHRHLIFLFFFFLFCFFFFFFFLTFRFSNIVRSRLFYILIF